jgi:uncharacterized protein (DUF952 family)
MPESQLVYKIVDRAAWARALTTGVFDGAPVDLADGYIHFSAAGQLRETARKHFAGQGNLLLVAFESDALGPALRWEVSRGGALFPHLYGSLDPKRALWMRVLGQRPDGVPDLEGLVP